jgi:hypothetical protein
MERVDGSTDCSRIAVSTFAKKEPLNDDGYYYI